MHRLGGSAKSPYWSHFIRRNFIRSASSNFAEKREPKLSTILRYLLFESLGPFGWCSSLFRKREKRKKRESSLEATSLRSRRLIMWMLLRINCKCQTNCNLLFVSGFDRGFRASVCFIRFVAKCLVGKSLFLQRNSHKRLFVGSSNFVEWMDALAASIGILLCGRLLAATCLKKKRPVGHHTQPPVLPKNAFVHQRCDNACKRCVWHLEILLDILVRHLKVVCFYLFFLGDFVPCYLYCHCYLSAWLQVT